MSRTSPSFASAWSGRRSINQELNGWHDTIREFARRRSESKPEREIMNKKLIGY